MTLRRSNVLPVAAPRRRAMFPAAALRAAPLGLALVMLAASADVAAAQSGQTAVAGAGACGQPTYLSVVLRHPLDSVAAAPVSLTLERFEPRYVEFTLADDGQVSLQTGTPDSGDPFLTVYDAQGGTVTWDDDGGDGLNALIETDLAAGTYCAQVRVLGSTPQIAIPVTLELSAGGSTAAPDPDQPRDQPLAAAEAGPCGDPRLTTHANVALAPGVEPVSLAAMVERNSQRNWTINVAQEMELRIDAASEDFDTVLSLFDDNGHELAENDDFPGLGTNSRMIESLPEGQYCVSLRGFAGSGGAATLTLSAEGETPPVEADQAAAPVQPATAPESERDTARPGSDARVVQLGELTDSISGSERTAAQTRWASFVLSQVAPVRLEVLSMAGPFQMRLIDQAGQITGESRGGGGTDLAMLEVQLAPGRYFIEIALDETDGTPQLHRIELSRGAVQ